jgi:repressor LexA
MQADEILKEIMTATGWNQARMAKMFRVSQGTISKWMNGQQIPNLAQWQPVQDAIRDNPLLAELRYLVDTGSVGVMGRVGAGSVIEPELEQIPPDGLYSVSLPFPVPSEMIGFVIEGDSMYPKYESGDVIVVYKDQRHAPTSYLGQLVVIMTEDGRRYLKKIYSGTQPGLYRLESFNAAPIHDVSVTWIGEIYASLPATQVFRTNEEKSPFKARKRVAAQK